jgi:hypothetical protein
MLRDGDAELLNTGWDAGPSSDAGRERRRATRRKLPLGRGAVLEIAGRPHIVGLGDVSVTGAYLITGARVAAGEVHRLRLIVVPGRPELALQVRIVRVVQEGPEKLHHPRGVAVQFVAVDEDAHRQLHAFVERGPLGRG